MSATDTLTRRAIKRSWLAAILMAIERGEADAAYRLTAAYVRRIRELGGPMKPLTPSKRRT